MAQDLPRIRALLGEQGLPVCDLDARVQFLVACAAGEVIGAGALEPYGETALLRSLVVQDSWRGRGLGRRLVKALERQARAAGVRELVLLTDSAQEFFAQIEFRRIERTQAPPAVRDSAEFRTLCPSSAVCMSKALRSTAPLK